jgi:hypothetical protein
MKNSEGSHGWKTADMVQTCSSNGRLVITGPGSGMGWSSGMPGVGADGDGARHTGGRGRKPLDMETWPEEPLKPCGYYMYHLL